MKAQSDVLEGNGLVIDSKIIFFDRSRLTDHARSIEAGQAKHEQKQAWERSEPGAVFCRERLRKKTEI